VTFSEAVTVKGKPKLKLTNGAVADYSTGSGSEKLIFTSQAAHQAQPASLDLSGGAIIACEASERIRPVEVTGSVPRANPS
jgi:hypothetical protein